MKPIPLSALAFVAAAGALAIEPTYTSRHVETAKGAAAAIRAKAPSNAKQIAVTPVELAKVSFLLAYGNEKISVAQNPDASETIEYLEEKLSFWTGVLAVLKSEYASISEHIRDLSEGGTPPEQLPAETAALTRSSSDARVVEAVIKDVRSDLVAAQALKFAAAGRESAGDILSRKTALFKRLSAKSK